MNRHIIYRQHVTIKIDKEEYAAAIQNTISDVLKNELPPMLESLFDEIASGNEIIRINSLQIDTGIIQAQNIKGSFIEQLLPEIKKAIITKKGNADTERGTVVVRKEQSLREALFHFLQSGTKLWFVAAKNKNEWEREMQQQFVTRDWQKIASWLKENYRQQPVILERLVRQFSDDFLHVLLPTLSSFAQDEWLTIYKNLFSLFQLVQPGKETGIRNKVWLTCFTSFLANQQQTDALYAVLKAPFDSSPEKASSFFTKKREYLESILQVAVLRELTERLINENAQQKAKQQSNDSDKKDTDNKTTLYKSSDVTGNEENETILRHQDKQYRDKQANAERDLSMNTSDGQQKNKRLPDHVGIEPQYVNNSGIILLHPFLEMYFDELGLLTERKFINADTCRRAILLLYYLATGENEIAEFDVLLQKILCGLSLEETLPNQLELTNNEREESDKLLQSVINYWPPLKHTSIEGLRSTFLQREGKLEKKENGWLLTVEQKTVDILLGKLPWGFSTIKLPWMNEMISVDWC